VPIFECPDEQIEATYYYRWWVYAESIHRDADLASGRWVVREGPGYGVTPCALGHHLYEGRWLKDRIYLDDYCQRWFDLIDNPAGIRSEDNSNPRGYANWLADACHARYLVDHDERWITAALPTLVENFAGWERERFDPEIGLFGWIPDRDGMEASLAGFEDGENDQFEWSTVIYGGAGYRPTLNSYMFADATAISSIARLAGDGDTRDLFERKARELKDRVQEFLWDADRQFFIQRRAIDGLFVSGREEIGFFPWAFHLPDDVPELAEAWRQLFDPDGFDARYGPTTLERRNPYFLRPFSHACLWNGPSWPYSTSLTLAALANLLDDYHQDVLAPASYADLLRRFAETHRDPDGTPMVREDHHPDENRWLAQDQHYNHSRFCDLVITGLVGLRPRPDDVLEVKPLIPDSWDYFCLDGVLYHGRTLTVLFDRSGDRYGLGPGFRVLVDGAVVMTEDEVRSVAVPAVVSASPF
jgi:hypothetical protein